MELTRRAYRIFRQRISEYSTLTEEQKEFVMWHIRDAIKVAMDEVYSEMIKNGS